MTTDHLYHFEQFQHPLSDTDSKNDKVSTFTGNSNYGYGYERTRQPSPNDSSILLEDIQLESLLLSDILKTCPNFSFFDELINIKSIEQAQSLLHYDLIKINNSILDINTYLNELILLLENLDTITNNNSPLNKYYDNIEWIYEGKGEILKISKNVDGIDSIISQFLHIIETKLDENSSGFFGNEDDLPSKSHNDDDSFFDACDDDRDGSHIHNHNCEKKKMEYLHLLANFDEISDLSLQVKKYLIVYKKRVDISIEFNELYYKILDSINDEIENCLKNCFKIHELKFNLKKFESIKIENFLKRVSQVLDKKNVEESRVIKNLPTFFNDAEERELYTQLDELKRSIEPIKSSIDFIKPQILHYCEQDEIQEFYGTSIKQINYKYNDIEEKYIFLINDMDDLQLELIDQRWSDCFKFLLNLVSDKIDLVEVDLYKSGILREGSPKMAEDTSIPAELRSELETIYKVLSAIEKCIERKIVHGFPPVVSLHKKVFDKWTSLSSRLSAALIKDLAAAENEESESGLKNTQRHVKKPSYDLQDQPIKMLKLRSKRNSGATNFVDRSPSVGSMQSPNFNEQHFQVRSFSLSRTTTINETPFNSPVFGEHEFQKNNQSSINHVIMDNSVMSPEPAEVVKKDISADTETGLGIMKATSEANEPTLEKKTRHRRSLTGSMLIGKMNLQPVLVEGAPQSPKKDTNFAPVQPRLKHNFSAAMRNKKVLSTVESVMDEEINDSPLTKRQSQIAEEDLDNKQPTSIEIEANRSVTSIENSRLAALSKLENGDDSADNTANSSRINDSDLTEDYIVNEFNSFSLGGTPRQKQIRKETILPKELKIVTHPVSLVSSDDDDDEEYEELVKKASIRSSVTSGGSSRKSSLSPVAAGQLRIKSPEKSNFEDSLKTLDRLNKMKKHSVNRTSWIPQPKSTMIRASSDGNIAGIKPRKTSSGRAKIIAKKV